MAGTVLIIFGLLLIFVIAPLILISDINKRKKFNSIKRELNSVEETAKMVSDKIEVINTKEISLSLMKIEADKYSEFNLQTNKPIFSFQWLVKTGDYVIKGQQLVKLNSGHHFRVEKSSENFHYTKFPETIIMTSPKDGYIKISPHNHYDNDNCNIGLFFLFDDDLARQQETYNINYKSTTDSFTREVRYTWDTVKLKSYLGFRLENISTNDYICFEHTWPELKISEKDKIKILLQNKEIIIFSLSKGNYKVSEYLRGFRIPIFKEEIESLRTFSIDSIRVEITNGNQHIDFIIQDEPDIPRKDKQYLIKSMFQCYNEVVNKLDNYSPLEKLTENNIILKSDEYCTVYVMVDKANNYCKIGISNKPEYREKTLQSEKPTIELLCYKNFPTRKIAESIEKALHESYKDRRIRGEWFNLNSEDINNILETLR